jgi:hypothetical protein
MFLVNAFAVSTQCACACDNKRQARGVGGGFARAAEVYAKARRGQ